MKKLIVMSESLNEILKEVSKREGINQSQLIEVAVTVYMMMFKGFHAEARGLNELLKPNQPEILEIIKKGFEEIEKEEIKRASKFN